MLTSKTKYCDANAYVVAVYQVTTSQNRDRLSEYALANF